MSLRPVTSRQEGKAAFDLLFQNLTRGCERLERTIGWQGGQIQGTVYWNPRLQLWSLLDARRAKKRYWCLFGTADAPHRKAFSIVCEINPPKGKYDRRTAGAFLRDEAGRIYLAHSGKIGGGHEGIGKYSFLASYRGPLEGVQWPDGKESDLIVIGPTDGQHLPSHVAHFVREVERFKHGARREDAGTASPLPSATFSPEFSGRRKSYRAEGTIASQCDHGPVISALADELQKRGLRFGNDAQRDLFILSSHGRVWILFEAKTDLGTTSLYGGVGQLMLHGAAERRAPRRVLVLPGTPRPKTRAALQKIGITVLSYRWDGDRPEFLNLDRALK